MCIFFADDLKVKAESLKFFENIRGVMTVMKMGKFVKNKPNPNSQNTIRILNPFEQSKYLNFAAEHYFQLLG